MDMTTKERPLTKPDVGSRPIRPAGRASEPITCQTARYIKLGSHGQWDAIAFKEGTLPFGYGTVSHELAITRDAVKIKKFLVNLGRTPQRAAEAARQVIDFYSLGDDCLWITFSDDHLWWTFAHAEVTWHGQKAGAEERTRKCIGGWRNTDINGKPLRMDTLSTRLTCVGNYRQTICAVGTKDYLLRRINGFVEPLVLKGNHARQVLLDVMTEAITSLHWADFETLIDVIFARSGWHRASAIGGMQKSFDLVLEQPATGERAAVQVKSRAEQGKLDAFVGAADEVGSFDRLFFACHSPSGSLMVPGDRTDLHIWSNRELAVMALRTGMSDWIMERVS